MPKCRHILCLGNAKQWIATRTVKAVRTLHVYGDTKIQSEFCSRCQQIAFIVKGRFSCCGKSASGSDYDAVKIEVDTTNKRRRYPTSDERAEILKQQQGRCLYCDAEFGTWRKYKGELRQVRIHWDHRMPFIYDGNNLEFVAACAECNHHKHAKWFPDLEDARSYLRQKIYESKNAPQKVVPELRRAIRSEEAVAEILRAIVSVGPLEQDESENQARPVGRISRNSTIEPKPFKLNL